MPDLPVDRRCVCNVVCGGAPDYKPAQVRLRGSLDKFLPGVKQLFWLDQLPPGSPTHAQAAYAFKWFAIQEAIRQGYSLILWMDSRSFLVDDPKPIFDATEANGLFVNHGGGVMGDYCVPEVLKFLGLTKPQACKIPLAGGSTFCLDADNPNGRKFFEEMLRLTGTIAYRHVRRNDDRDRVDEPCISYVVNLLGLNQMIQCWPQVDSRWGITGPPQRSHRYQPPPRKVFSGGSPGHQVVYTVQGARTPPYRCFGSVTSYKTKEQLAQLRRSRLFPRPT